MMPRARIRLVAVLCLAGTFGCALSERAYETLTIRAPGKGVDVNNASVDELAALPGIEKDDAERIVRARPYETKSDLVRRGVVSEQQFAEFQARIYVGHVGEAAPPPSEEPRHAARNVGD